MTFCFRSSANPTRDDSRDDIDIAPGRERHDKANRPLGPALRERPDGREERTQQGRCECSLHAVLLIA
jgi:hypothetical protein